MGIFNVFKIMQMVRKLYKARKTSHTGYFLSNLSQNIIFQQFRPPKIESFPLLNSANQKLSLYFKNGHSWKCLETPWRWSFMWK